MVLVLVLSLLPQPVVAEIDKLARSREAEKLLEHCAAPLAKGPNPFRFLRFGGAYGGGRFGWNAAHLRDAAGSGEYVVFATALTGEDIGAQVFRFEGGKLTARVPELETFGASFDHHDFEIWFDLPAKSVRIVDVARMRFGGNAKAVQFRLSPHYRVSAISGPSGRLDFAQAGGVVSMAVPAGVAEAQIRIEYGGVVDLPEYAGSISPNEATLTNDFWWPQIARGAATYSAKVHAPKNWTVIAQGEQVGVQDSATERVTTFRMTLPNSVFSLSAGPYRSGRKTIAGREYRMLSTSTSEEDMAMQAELNAPVIRFYEKTFGPYPFTSWTTLESRVYGGGALEAYSFATYGTGWLPAEDPHEPAHTWWGGVIPNTYLRSLWNESFAVYSEGLYQREGGPPDFDEKHRRERREAFVSDVGPQAAYRNATCAEASCEIGPAAGALGYGKGAAVLQALEGEIGVEAMKRTLKAWIEQHPKGKTGEWEDYEAIVAKTLGKDMKPFFDQWIRRTGWPDFSIDGVGWADGRLRGTVRFEGQAYRIGLETMLEYPGGDREFTTVDTMQSGSGLEYRFDIPCPKKPSLVSFDPWRRLLRRYGSDERPPSLALADGMRSWVEPKREDWESLAGRRKESRRPDSAAGFVWIAHPETDPVAADLCRRVGFRVNGNELTYDGTTIDLRKGAAMAVVDLEGDHRAIIALGSTRLPPDPGRARLGLFDDYGRLLRARTAPKTRGFLTFRL